MAQKVALQANKGHYVVAEGGGGGVVNANRSQIGIWEVFTLAALGNGNVALMANNGNFVCAEGGGGREVVANRTAIGPWETFGLQSLGGSAIALTANNGQFVCAEGGGGGVVNANRNAVGPWETFQLIQNPTVTSGANSTDVRAEAMPWGLVVTLSHTAAQDLIAAGIPSAALLAAIGGVVSTGVLAIVGAAIAAVLGLVKAVDTGNGVYLTMLWITPGVFIPTTRP